MSKTRDFKFLDVGTLSDSEIELIVKGKLTPAKLKENGYPKGYPPQYTFDVRLRGESESIGYIHLRIGRTKWVTTQGGNIGYSIDESYQGHRYAAKACNLVKPVLIAHGFRTAWIMCDPDNQPSRRICEILGCRLVDIMDTPVDSELYRLGAKRNCRYRWDLGEPKND